MSEGKVNSETLVRKLQLVYKGALFTVKFLLHHTLAAGFEAFIHHVPPLPLASCVDAVNEQLPVLLTQFAWFALNHWLTTIPVNHPPRV